MSTATEYDRPDPRGWFNKSEAWLDERGKGAWIAVMVLGFIAFWPVGLAVLFYMIWSKRMFNKSCGHGRTHMHRHAERMGRRHGFHSSGNTAFDAYKAETLQRLMDEQEQFEAFLERLRAAKDKREFDQFMEDRAAAPRNDKAGDEDDADKQTA
jgi:hypothetical protein